MQHNAANVVLSVMRHASGAKYQGDDRWSMVRAARRQCAYPESANFTRVEVKEHVAIFEFPESYIGTYLCRGRWALGLGRSPDGQYDEWAYLFESPIDAVEFKLRFG